MQTEQSTTNTRLALAQDFAKQINFRKKIHTLPPDKDIEYTKKYGRRPHHFLSGEELQHAKHNQLLVIIGESDDEMICMGCFDKHIFGNKEFTAYLNTKNIFGIAEIKKDDDSPYVEIKAQYDCNKERSLSWEFITTVPHATISIFEPIKMQLFCTGLVIPIHDSIFEGHASPRKATK